MSYDTVNEKMSGTAKSNEVPHSLDTAAKALLGARAEARLDPVAPLTPREIEVLMLAADGLSGPELAQVLQLSPATVNAHFKNIYRKLNVRNRAAAVATAMRLGVIG